MEVLNHPRVFSVVDMRLRRAYVKSFLRNKKSFFFSGRARIRFGFGLVDLDSDLVRLGFDLVWIWFGFFEIILDSVRNRFGFGSDLVRMRFGLDSV